jgi:hypothetical protein
MQKSFIGFEPVERLPDYVKCLPCSEAYLGTKEIAKNSISSHRRTAAHTVALERWSSGSGRISDVQDATMTRTELHAASSLNVAADFEASDSDEDRMRDIQAESANPFDGAIVYDHDIIC